MKSNAKSKTIILLTIGILFALSPIINNNFNFNGGNIVDFPLDNENLKISEVSGKIRINDANPTMNWSVAKKDGICTGNGTYSEPYVIEDLQIDGDGSGSCILIENSDAYFRIENCTLFDSGGSSGDAGIKLSNVTNALLIDNNCSSNYQGIYLTGCYNTTISGNTANNNSIGIYLTYSYNNTIIGNTANDSILNYGSIMLIYSNNNTVSGNFVNSKGIYLSRSINTSLTGNIMNDCGVWLFGYDIKELDSHHIDLTNLVNGKPLYYYTNEVNLGPSNFTNAGQVILISCHDSLISNLNSSYGYIGLSLYYCNNNTISGNIANNNVYGIYIGGDNNTISGNTANNNTQGDGFRISGDNNLILGNNANYNAGNGIDVSGDNNIISENIANFNLGIGICIISDWGIGGRNLISQNTANNNDLYGIYISDGDKNNISGNTANFNSLSGIMTLLSEDNTISGNNASFNGVNGFWIDGGSNSEIIENCANYNGGVGFLIRGGVSGGDITGNTASYNQIGIKLFRCNYNIVSGNSLIGNDVCITEVECGFWGENIFSNNGACMYGQDGGIPFELIILISVISGGAVIGVATLLLVRRKRKRME